MTRIVIRHAEPQDAQALCELNSRPEVYANTLQIPYPSITMWQERLHTPPTGRRQFVAIMDDRIVGHLALSVEQSPRRSHVATFGFSVLPEARNQGVGRALLDAMIEVCDNWLPVTRIELTVFADNEAAIALYRKVGFVDEGMGRQYALRGGKLIDALYMARSRP